MSFRVDETYRLNFASEENASTYALDQALALARYVEAAKKDAPGAGAFPSLIYPQFHILSADKVTRNKTLYTTDAHKGNRKQRTGQFSFTKPYPIPLIGDHRATPECGSAPSESYGRIVDAKLVKDPASGRGHVAGLGEVTHPNAIEEILTGRWLTGSLGSSVHEACCSICEAPLATSSDLDYHIHQRGKFYRKADPKKDPAPQFGDSDAYIQTDPNDKQGQLCYLMIGGYQAKEYSRVNIPSDDESLVTVQDTQTMAGSHFTKNGEPMGGGESYVPQSRIWVPMSPSSRSNVESWGSRYVDLVTGQERPASEMGLLHGPALYQHYECVMSGEDMAILESASALSERQRVWVNAWEALESAPASTDTVVEELSTPSSPPNAPESPAVTQPEAPAAPSPAPAGVTAKTRTGYPVVFCGAESTFPVTDALHYNLALDRLETYTGADRRDVQARILQVGRQRGFHRTSRNH